MAETAERKCTPSTPGKTRNGFDNKRKTIGEMSEMQGLEGTKKETCVLNHKGKPIRVKVGAAATTAVNQESPRVMIRPAKVGEKKWESKKQKLGTRINHGGPEKGKKIEKEISCAGA